MYRCSERKRPQLNYDNTHLFSIPTLRNVSLGMAFVLPVNEFPIHYFMKNTFHFLHNDHAYEHRYNTIQDKHPNQKEAKIKTKIFNHATSKVKKVEKSQKR